MASKSDIAQLILALIFRFGVTGGLKNCTLSVAVSVAFIRH